MTPSKLVMKKLSWNNERPTSSDFALEKKKSLLG
jgi:hypothetical protein